MNLIIAHNNNKQMELIHGEDLYFDRSNRKGATVKNISTETKVNQ